MKPSEIKKGMLVAAVWNGLTYRATVVDPKPGAVVEYQFRQGSEATVEYKDKLPNRQGILKKNSNVLVELQVWSYNGNEKGYLSKVLRAISPYKLGEPSQGLLDQWAKSDALAAQHNRSIELRKKKEQKVVRLLERLGLPKYLGARWRAHEQEVRIPIPELEKLVRRYEARGRKAKA